MISHKYRCIFVHQRKSAGTAVKAIFEDYGGEARQNFNNGILDPRWDPEDPVIRDYFKFTVIRNPWDRFVSGWMHCASTRHRPILDVIENLPRPSLWSNVLGPRQSARARIAYGRELLRQGWLGTKYAARQALGRPAHPPAKPGHDWRHVTRQQWQTVVYPDGRLAVDKVVYFEDLDRGLQEVCAAIGKPYAPLPALRVRRAGDDYRRHFDARARAAFSEAFRGDIDYWGYDFETGRPTALQ
jgi:hypothetical protein